MSSHSAPKNYKPCAVARADNSGAKVLASGALIIVIFVMAFVVGVAASGV